MTYYARISYNSRGWAVPTGPEGKSNNLDTHEGRYGFGFEEWLFNKRRFKDENKQNCHLGYLEPLKFYNHKKHENVTLVLYTIQKMNNGNTNKFIVCSIPKGCWRFIDRTRYMVLRDLNNEEIEQIRGELQQTPNLSNHALKRYDDQKDCMDWDGKNSNTHRLWNIEILKPLDKINTNVISNKDKQILKNKNRFQLYKN
jgi:hypothetical protein